MSTDDPVFSDRIVSTRNVPVPHIMRSVGEAIDLVNRLPEEKQASDHWKLARHLLYEAFEDPEEAVSWLKLLSAVP